MKEFRCTIIWMQVASAIYICGLIVLFSMFHGYLNVDNGSILTYGASHPDLPALNISLAPWLSSPVLPRSLSQSQHDLYIQLLEGLSKLFFAANITFLLCDGSLLGSYVMHDMLPWDDDVDLMVRYRDMAKVKRIFRNADLWDTYDIRGYHDPGNEYDRRVLQGLTQYSADRPHLSNEEGDKARNNHSHRLHKFKFFYKNTEKAGNQSWNWPFIDVKYYKENSTHIWNLDLPNRTRVLKADEFYPLHLRPFSRLWLPSPNNPQAFLISHYRHFACRRSKWNHRLETRQTPRKVRCWKLSHWYPFVWREDLPRGTLEVLKLDDRTVQMVGVPETYSVFQRPFAL